MQLDTHRHAPTESSLYFLLDDFFSKVVDYLEQEDMRALLRTNTHIGLRVLRLAKFINFVTYLEYSRLFGFFLPLVPVLTNLRKVTISSTKFNRFATFFHYNNAAFLKRMTFVDSQSNFDLENGIIDHQFIGFSQIPPINLKLCGFSKMGKIVVRSHRPLCMIFHTSPRLNIQKLKIHGAGRNFTYYHDINVSYPFRRAALTQLFFVDMKFTGQCSLSVDLFPNLKIYKTWNVTTCHGAISSPAYSEKDDRIELDELWLGSDSEYRTVYLSNFIRSFKSVGMMYVSHYGTKRAKAFSSLPKGKSPNAPLSGHDLMFKMRNTDERFIRFDKFLEKSFTDLAEYYAKVQPHQKHYWHPTVISKVSYDGSLVYQSFDMDVNTPNIPPWYLLERRR